MVNWVLPMERGSHVLDKPVKPARSAQLLLLKVYFIRPLQCCFFEKKKSIDFAKVLASNEFAKRSTKAVLCIMIIIKASETIWSTMMS